MSYFVAESPELLELLRKAAPKVPDQDAQAAMHRRLMVEMDNGVKGLIETYHELRDGELDRRLAAVVKLGTLRRTLGWLEQQVRDLEDVLSEYGDRTPGEAYKTIEMLRLASDLGVIRNSGSPRAIKSEGAFNSKNLASAILDEFLLIATFVWYQGTGKPPKPFKTETGEPSGPYAKFMAIVAQPLIKELNRNRNAGISGNWPSLCQRLDRTIKVRSIELYKTARAEREAGAEQA